MLHLFWLILNVLVWLSHGKRQVIFHGAMSGYAIDPDGSSIALPGRREREKVRRNGQEEQRQGDGQRCLFSHSRE
jgi:hypothetical protein